MIGGTRSPLPALTLLGCAVCAGPADDVQPKDSDLPSRTFPETIGGERPVVVLHPESFDRTRPLPAIVLLHGFGATGVLEDLIFQLGDRVDAEQFLLLRPDGTVDANGARYWDAGAECCGDAGPPVDDVAYLGGLVDELRATWRVASVTFVGHSNGGYMSYRLACEAPEKLDRMVVLAGSDPVAPPACVAGHAVGLLHVHGTADDTVPYEAGAGPVATPGAVVSAGRHAARMGCGPNTVDLGAADLLSGVDGRESTGAAYQGCAAPVALWTSAEGDHLFLTATDAFRAGVLAFALGGPAAFP